MPAGERTLHFASRRTLVDPADMQRPKNGISAVTRQELLKMLAPIAAILVALACFYGLPNVYPSNYTPGTYGIFLLLCLAAYLVTFAASLYFWKLRKYVVYYTWIAVALVLILELLDVLTLKTGYLQLPFCPSPDRIILTFVQQIEEIVDALGASLSLLWLGILIGTVTGVISGSLIGWSHFCDYWVMGLLRIIGPIPSAVWIPIAMTIMPSSYAACLFIISLAVWFPLTLMLGSAIKNTENRLVEVSRCLGARRLQVFFRVAWPSALPAFFDGMFMGLASSFGALAVVEMIGAQSGLGFIINYTRVWAQFDKMFCAMLVLVVVFAVIILLFFQVRNRALRWQVGLKRE